MKRLDLTDHKYGRLVVVSISEKRGKNIYWNCQCECGNLRAVSTTHLRSGHTISCGCFRNETSAQTAKNNSKHGMWRTREFGIWNHMIQRCHNKNHQKYSLYGGRGIEVCEEWRNSFSAFFEHIGPRPSQLHSVDRIDSNKGYEPGNVRWATIDVQNNNKRTNVFITFKGVQKTIAQWSRETGITQCALAYRFRAGWSEERIFAEATQHLGDKSHDMMASVLVEFEDRPARKVAA